MAGTYRSSDGTDCNWNTKSDFTGSDPSNVGHNSANHGPDIVTLSASNVGFSSDGCGMWSPLPANLAKVSSFGDGTWVVGSQLTPGAYHAPGSSDCYWSRLSDFAGRGSASEVDTHYGPGATTVTITSTDKGFASDGCGTWTAG